MKGRFISDGSEAPRQFAHPPPAGYNPQMLNSPAQTQLNFKQIDVFSAQPFMGNPLAVVLGADGWTTEQMQRFANWTNLSETTFLLSPTHPLADYKVRIFTTSQEFPFAGHPTLGSCHAWLEAGGAPKNADEVVQECGAGLVKIKRRDGRLAFAAPPLTKTGPLDDGLLNRLVRGLGLSPADVLGHQWLVNGPRWIGLHLRSAALVLSIKPDFSQLTGLDFGLIGAYPSGHAAQFEVRGFAITDGPIEDPVTGSLNAGFAQWLIGAGVAPSKYIASQGTALGRAGRLYLEQDGAGSVWVGGDAVTRVNGTLST